MVSAQMPEPLTETPWMETSDPSPTDYLSSSPTALSYKAISGKVPHFDRVAVKNA